MKKIIFLLLILFLLSPSFGFAEDVSSREIKMFEEANQLYVNGNYKSAIMGFEKLINDYDVRNAQLFANLARAFYRNDNLGESIFYMEKARMLEPRNPEIVSDLKFLSNQTVDKINDSQGNFISKIIYGLENNVSLAECYYSLVLLFIVFWALLSIRLFKPNKWFGNLAIVIFILIVLNAGMLLLKKTSTNFGVVKGDLASVFSAPGLNNVLLFELHEGSDFYVKSSRDGWSKIKLKDGKTGWIDDNDIIKIKFKK